MYSFVGDTVLDPFAGIGTTTIAASRNGRDSISIEVDEEYLEIAKGRLEDLKLQQKIT
ncbi:DNA modification methylase [Halorhabdus sp. BNX81]|nr:DNA modification methylase [Halorhabdus sp. BNX81]